MRTRILQGLLIIVTLIIIVFLVYNRYKIQNREKDAIESYNAEFNEKMQCLERQTMYNIIPDRVVYWGNDSLHAIRFRDIAPAKLFFYFSAQTCPPCVEGTIDLINQMFSDSWQTENLCFISPDSPRRLAENCYAKMLLNIGPELGLYIETIHVPFFFELNENLEVKSVNIVNKLDLSRTKAYLKRYKESKLKLQQVEN